MKQKHVIQYRQQVPPRPVFHLAITGVYRKTFARHDGQIPRSVVTEMLRYDLLEKVTAWYARQWFQDDAGRMISVSMEVFGTRERAVAALANFAIDRLRDLRQAYQDDEFDEIVEF